MLLAPLFAFGQGSQLPKYTVANLPAASTQVAQLYNALKTKYSGVPIQ
jgi:hypothetical protein